MTNPNRREQRSWYFYDWANSAFSTTVAALFFGPYLISVARAQADADGFVSLLGIPLAATAVANYTIAFSVVCQAFALPLFGAIADYGRRKREMLGTLAFIGATATVCMFFITDGRWLLGSALFVLANVSFGAANIIYNSFLPEIAAPEERDGVSSRGWGLGYAGGGLLLALNLLFFNNAESLGVSGSMAVRISLASAGIWWGLFTIIPLTGLRNRGPQKSLPQGQNLVSTGFRRLIHTLGSLRHYPQTLLFLIAYLLYNDAIQTVLGSATQFASVELRMADASLAAALLMTQFVALFGALAFGRLALVIGNKRSVMLALVIWCATLLYMYLAVYDGSGFFIGAGMIGFVMGGSQALSRSLYSFMIPKGKEAEYFSLSELSDKGSSWLGPLLLGLQTQFTGSMRGAILSLALFFVVGLILLARLDVNKAALEAGNTPPPRG